MPAVTAKTARSDAFSMHPFLHTAKVNATGNFCILPGAIEGGVLHIANMDDQKNGGPNFLQAWRLHKRMTLQELADKIGTTAGVIHHLENGDRGLSAKWLRKLAPALDTTPGHLLDLHPDDANAEVLSIWSGVPEDKKPQALRVLETFKSGTDG